MRRRVTAAVCAAALIGLVPLVNGASASAPTSRVVSGKYSSSGGSSLGTTQTTTTTGLAAVTATTESDEDSVAVGASDSGGSAVALAIDVTPKGSSTKTRTLACSNASMAASAGSTIAVYVLSGRCSSGATSTPSSGSVSLVFHKKPVTAAAPTPSHVAPPSLRFAVLIGIKDYQGNTESTVGGAGDIAAVKKALINSGWMSSHILVLTEGKATQAGIRNSMTWLAQHSDARTFSLLHFSGHVCIESRGPCASGHTYLWSVDNKFIPETEVDSRMEAIKGHQWLDLSGCEGGAFDHGYHSATRMFTASSKPSETSYEEPKWHESVWSGMTWDLGYDQGLADPHHKAYNATMYQMAQYSVTNAPKYTAKQAKGPQHPILTGGASSWSLKAPPGA